jgi:hypothetical protein
MGVGFGRERWSISTASLVLGVALAHRPMAAIYVRHGPKAGLLSETSFALLAALGAMAAWAGAA